MFLFRSGFMTTGSIWFEFYVYWLLFSSSSVRLTSLLFLLSVEARRAVTLYIKLSSLRRSFAAQCSRAKMALAHRRCATST